jgi:hypothetical protein
VDWQCLGGSGLASLPLTEASSQVLHVVSENRRKNPAKLNADSHSESGSCTTNFENSIMYAMLESFWLSYHNHFAFASHTYTPYLSQQGVLQAFDFRCKMKDGTRNVPTVRNGVPKVSLHRLGHALPYGLPKLQRFGVAIRRVDLKSIRPVDNTRIVEIG